MQSPVPSLLLLGSVLATPLVAARADAQVDQREVAQRLLQGNAVGRVRAVQAAQALGPQDTGPELRQALITALERELEIRVQRYDADRRGEELGPLENPEFLFGLSRAVAALEESARDSGADRCPGHGSTVTRALVAFGEQAVPTLLAAVRSPETIHYVVDDALIALRYLVEGAGPGPLAANTVDAIRRAAEQRLTGQQYFTTLWRAIDLAMVLDDPHLRGIVQALASDRQEVIARGIENPELIEDTQQRAADRLAGVPPKPRWH